MTGGSWWYTLESISTLVFIIFVYKDEPMRAERIDTHKQGKSLKTTKKLSVKNNIDISNINK